MGDDLLSTLQFLATTPHPTPDKTLQLLLLPNHYFYEKYSDELNSQVPLIQAFKARSHHATYTGSIHLHFRSYLISIMEFPLGQLLPTNRDSRENAFPTITIFTSSNLGLAVIFPTYAHILRFLPFTFGTYATSSFSKFLW